MNQTEHACGCAHPEYTMLPIRGFGLAVDTSALPVAPGTTPTCRERVEEDMHIYINGDLEVSGDGLSPQTAVKSYEDAVLALSRYDGRNLHDAHFHFASLGDSAAVYPDFAILPGHCVTFAQVHVSGESHETTHCGACTICGGCCTHFSDICLTYLQNLCSYTVLDGKTAFRPEDKKYALISKYGGAICFEPNSEMFFHGGTYHACLYIVSSIVYNTGMVKFHTLAPISVGYAFAYCGQHGALSLEAGSDYADCASVTGAKYWARGLSMISVPGKTLPGTKAGRLENGSVYM